MNIYIGNLSRDVTEVELREQFEKFGRVDSASIVKDRRGVSKGFAYVEMDSADEGQAAMEALKGQMLDGRTMDIVESAPPSKGKKGFKGGKKRRRF